VVVVAVVLEPVLLIEPVTLLYHSINDERLTLQRKTGGRSTYTGSGIFDH